MLTVKGMSVHEMMSIWLLAVATVLVVVAAVAAVAAAVTVVVAVGDSSAQVVQRRATVVLNMRVAFRAAWRPKTSSDLVIIT